MEYHRLILLRDEVELEQVPKQHPQIRVGCQRKCQSSYLEDWVGGLRVGASSSKSSTRKRRLE